MSSTILSDHRDVKLQDWDQRHREESRDKPSLPIPFITEIVHPLKPGKALDLACGTGRHALWLARESWSVTAVDGSSAAIGILNQQKGDVSIETRIADLEQHEYSIIPDAWDLIVISLYLQRDLFEPAKLGVKPGGALIAITLLSEEVELRPHRLRPGELKSYFAGWEILNYSEESSQARIAARRPVGQVPDLPGTPRESDLIDPL
jgi:SAM-dependent methyltransferase